MFRGGVPNCLLSLLGMLVRMKLRRSPLGAVARHVMMVLRKCPIQVLKNLCRIVLVVWHLAMKVMGSKGWWWLQRGQR